MVNPVSQTVSSVNLINSSPSQTSGLYNSDLFSFAGVNHGVSNTQVVTSYTPQPLYPAYSQPVHDGAFQWCPTTLQGTVFTSRVTGVLKSLVLTLRCVSSSNQSRLMQIGFYTSSLLNPTLLSATTVSVSPSQTFTDLAFDVSAVVANVVQGQAYKLTLQDLTGGGNSSGWIEWSGVSSGVHNNSAFFSVVPRYTLSASAIGGNTQYVYQQTVNDAATQWIQADGNQAFVFTTPGDVNTVFEAATGSAVLVAFDGSNATRTISTSMYRGNLVAQGQVANPPANQLVYNTQTTLDMTNNGYSYAPVSVVGNQQLNPNQTTINISGGTTGAGLPFNIAQNVDFGTNDSFTAEAGQTNVWHLTQNGVVLSVGSSDYGHYQSGILTPSNLQDNAQEVQVVITGNISSLTYAPTLTFQAWWSEPGDYQAILNPMSVVADLGPSTDGTTSPFVATFTYNQAEASNVQFTQAVDVIVQYTYDAGAGTSTFTNTEVNWTLLYPASATAGAIPIQGGTMYTFVWNDESPAGNDTGFTMFLGADAQTNGLSALCSTPVYPWVNFTDALSNQPYFAQTSSDPWALQGLLPDGHEIGYWFSPSATLQLLSVTISLLCYQENAGQRYIQAQLRQGNADDLSGPILESLPVLVVVAGQQQGTLPVQLMFTFSGTTVLTSGQDYTFSVIDSTGDGNTTGGIYVYGVLDDQTALGWDQNGLTQWPHPWVSAQMSVYAGQLVLETASDQTAQDLTGLYTLGSLAVPFTIQLGDEGFLSAFSFLGSSFGARTVQVSLYSNAGGTNNLLYQTDVLLPDTVGPFSTESTLVNVKAASQQVYAIGNQIAQLQVLASVGAYSLQFVDVSPNNNSSTSAVYMYGLASTPQLNIIVPIYTLSFGPPQALSSFVGNFDDVIQFSPNTTDNLSVLHIGGTIISTSGKNLSSGWFYVVLDWLIVPKQIMSAGIGGLLSNYPYVYVVLVNSGSNTAQNLIHSNNRNLPPTASFIVEVSTWLYSADPKAFYTLKPSDADSRPQLMQLRLDQPISFQVVLPSGVVVAFKTLDNVSPSPINPLVQVSASFKLTPV